MELIVADANIFVYLFCCGVLTKLLSNEIYDITITNAVYDEITSPKKRISREHPKLKETITRIIHNKNQVKNYSALTLITETCKLGL